MPERKRVYDSPSVRVVVLRPEERLMACDKHGKVGGDPAGWTCLGKNINST